MADKVDSAAGRSASDSIDYSIVIPVYFNEGSLRPTFESIAREAMAKNPGLSCEVIFVDDGSGDGSLAELISLQEENPDVVKVIKLTRNFGQPSARLAGLAHARGRCVISKTADEQDPAALLNDMLGAYFEEGFEVVICARAGRDESFYRSLTSGLFYRLMKMLRFQNMPAGGFDYVLLGRRALDAILHNREANPFFQGQILWTGFKPKIIEYRRQSRKVGGSRWTLGKKMKLMIDAVLGYSYAPVRLMSLGGVLTAFFGFIVAAILVVRRMIWGTAVEGWTATVVIVLMTSGVQMLMIGVIGEYLWRSLAQVRNRAPYVIEKIYAKPNPLSYAPPEARTRQKEGTARPGSNLARGPEPD